jgi:hypothetical protein
LNILVFIDDLVGRECGSPFKNTFGTAVLGTAEFIGMVTSERLWERDSRYGRLGREQLPAAECLQDTVERFLV